MSTSTEKNGNLARGPKMRSISRNAALRTSAYERVEANSLSSKRRSYQDRQLRYRSLGVRDASSKRRSGNSRASYTVPQAAGHFDMLGRLFSKIFLALSKPDTQDYYDQYDPMRKILASQQSWRSDGESDYKPSGYVSGHF